MSTSIPLLSENDINAIVSWMKEECQKPYFDPNQPEFQAAIAIIAANDKAKQQEILRMLPPEKTFLFTGEGLNDDTLSKLFRVAMYRNISRHYQVQPSIQRAAFPMPSQDSQEIRDLSVSSLEYLTPHIQPNHNALSAFRASFLNGVNQPPQFMSERRQAILNSWKTSTATRQIDNETKKITEIVFIPEIKNISIHSQQINFRKQLVRFTLDKAAANLPDYSTRILTHQHQSVISPQHIGIKTVYDIVSGVDHTKKSTRLNLLLNQASKFKRQLDAKMKIVNEVKHALALRNRAHEKEKKNKNSESVRLQALKKNDINEYRRLVNEMKDNRIKLLLDKTDKYMKDLMDKINNQHTGTTDTKMPENINELGIVLPDVVQPKHLEGALKDYQLKGLQWLVSLYQSHLNGILADEMGLGKTIQTIALLAWLWENRNDAGPHLVCAPLSTLPNWKAEFEKWLPVFNVVQYTGNPNHRKELQATALVRGSNTNVVLTSFEFATRDKAALGRLDYSYLIIDEAHKLKNDQGKLFQALSSYKCHNRLLLTGTPLQNNSRELWSLLNFVLPNIFNDHNQFEEWFAAPFGKNSDNVSLSTEEQWLVINQLHAVLRPFLFRRLASDVANELPDMVDHKIICSMSAWQKAVYKTLVEDSSIVVEGPKVLRLDNQTMQLRKVCNHPYLFLDTYYVNANFIRAAGKFDILDRILPKFKATGHRVLIFSLMTEVLNLLEDLLKYLGLKYSRLDGSTKGETRQQLIKDFNDPNSESFIFLLSTRAGGLGLNLQSADTVILYDNDWNPFADQQARSRVHRIGQSKSVLVISLVTANSVEERVLDRADEKKSLENKIIEVGRFDDESNLDDRKKLYQQLIDQSNSEEDSHIHNNEQINKFIARTPEEFDLFQKMDQERNIRYQKEWEEGGHVGKYPPLMQADELPAYLKIPINEIQKDNNELPTIRKSRSTVSFTAKLENMTDNEYARLIERGEDPTEHIGEIQEKREHIESLFNNVQEMCKGLFDTLPTPEQLPQYYQIISHPITLNEIKQRVRDGDYDNVQELIVDLKLMANNALRFNEPNSEYCSIARNIIQACDDATSSGDVRREMPVDMSFEFE